MPRAVERISAARTFGVGLATAILLAAGAPALADVFESQHGPVRVETVASGLVHPWGLAFLPDRAMLVTERPGRVRIATPDGALSQPLSGTPDVAASGQGGMLDVALDPDFETNNLVYLAFAEARDGGAALSVARARLDRDGLALHDVETIFRQQPATPGGRHFGARLAFSPDGTLFISSGDRGDRSDDAQEPGNHIGALMRINPDGSIPPGNPAETREGWAPEVWSIGHRNIQGAAIEPATGILWTNEHGARGGDEINIPEAGLNYGWPVIAYGRHYSGAPIGEGTHREGMEQPVYYWDPSIAPSGMAFYEGDVFPEWRGDIFIGALAGQHLARLSVEGASIVAEERLLDGLQERIRDVRSGPDGMIYLLTDASDGRILRLVPADR
ncbi:MAG: PQQ-dependent sugar dehydrogenase [Salinarimonadaceae bacterium]|nr:MAG: PQQ-dependent sugar dehydrogenase [Salinarimonadaceae bacterium]